LLDFIRFSKEKSGVYKKSHRPTQSLIKLTENQLLSVSMACQSPAAIDRLLNSGLPHALTRCILGKILFPYRNKIYQIGTKNRHFVIISKKHGITCFYSDAVIYFFLSEWCGHRQINDKKGGECHSLQNCHKLCFLPEGLLSIEGVAIVLDFLADICAEGRMRDWLGSTEGSLFWLPLLHKLCNEQLPQDIQNRQVQFSYL
jgi:baculoviral IAP repeat-containing protein 6